jgi:hypothetical protein
MLPKAASARRDAPSREARTKAGGKRREKAQVFGLIEKILLSGSGNAAN